MNETLRRIHFTPMRDVVRGRLTGRLDLDRMLAESQLPAPAAQCVRTVVKRTRLWPLEKIDVAQELTAHFHDGLEAGASVEELLANFGDVRRTARLIRRAKARQRPLAWRIGRFFGWTLAALVVLFLGQVAILFAGNPSIDVDYLAKLNARAAAVPEEQRAWPLYRQALLAVGYHGDDKTLLEELLRDGSKPGEPRWDEMVQFLRDHQSALALAREASTCPGLGYQAGFGFHESDRELFAGESMPYSTDETRGSNDVLSSAFLLHLSPLFYVRQLLAADAHLAVIDADGDRVYRDMVAMLGIATHAAETPFLINGFAAMRIRGRTVALLNEIIQDSDNPLADAQLRDLAHELGAHRRLELIRFDGERYTFMDIVQRVYSKGGRLTNEGVRMLGVLDPVPDIKVRYGLAVAPEVILLLAPHDEMVEMYDSMIGRVERAMNVPMRQLPTSGVAQEVKGWSRVDRARYALVRLLLPTLNAVRSSYARDQARIDGALVGIALELYRRDTGQWPKTLDELVPRFLPAVPVDRITGAPVRYRLVDAKPLIYSVGCDLDDDGGRAPHIEPPWTREQTSARWLTEAQRKSESLADGDWMLWPIQGQ